MGQKEGRQYKKEEDCTYLRSLHALLFVQYRNHSFELFEVWPLTASHIYLCFLQHASIWRREQHFPSLQQTPLANSCCHNALLTSTNWPVLALSKVAPS